MDNMGKHSWFTTVKHLLQFTKLDKTTLDLANIDRGTKRLVSVNICSVERNSADIFVSKESPGMFVIKVK